ncbi:MAG: chemotaxis protein CheX [Magnetococcales bacterium]|nr:chemotaxis protein CheX [Magnetococcales bacterium]
MEKRKHTRVPVQVTAELELPQGVVVRTQSVNFSVAGAGLENVPVDVAFVGCRSQLRLFLSMGTEALQEHSHIIQFQAQVVRQDGRGIGIRLLDADIERFTAFRDLLLKYATHPEKILEEIKKSALISGDVVEVVILREQLSQFVRDGVHNIFGSMMRLQPVLEQTILHPVLEPVVAPQPQVAALIGFNGAIDGGVILATSFSLSTRLAMDLAGRPVEEFNVEAMDAFGELANMMAGEVQTGLSTFYEQINLTPPTIISGNSFRLDHKRELHRVMQVFRVEEDFFTVECFFS